METRAHYVAVGAFVLAIITVAFAVVLWLARAQLTTQYALYDIYFAGPVSGLREGAAVEYSGVPAGRVAEIKITPENVERIRVTVEIETTVVIKQNAAASVEGNLLSGVSFIQIVGGTQDAPVLTKEAGQRYPVIRSRRSRLASVSARAPQLLEKLNETANHLNDLLDEKNRAAVTESLENIRVITAAVAERKQDIAELTGNANTAVLSLNSLLLHLDQSYFDPQGLRDALAGGLADFDWLARNLAETNRQLQLTLQDVRPGVRNFGQRTLSDVGELVGEFRQLISGLSRLAAGIERDPSRVLFGDRREGYRPQ
jgi:phospholipid/cholesterol/gamma-HCH transport system substrate-binding protein